MYKNDNEHLSLQKTESSLDDNLQIATNKSDEEKRKTKTIVIG